MSPNCLPETFLKADATPERQWLALQINVQAWYERWALAQGNSKIGRDGELLWTYSQLTIPSEDSLQDDRLIHHILNWYRSQNPLHGAIFWYLHQTPPTRLGARLFARGVGPNWEPHWMWCELCHLQSNHERKPNFEIRILMEGVSEFDNKLDPTIAALAKAQPRRVWHLEAFQQGLRVGGCILNVTTGKHGVGGLFDMWVATEARRQGIGTALTQATCELARQLGCLHVVTNATEMGEPVYRRVGFRSMGRGYTWYLNDTVLTKPPPTSDMVRFLEALGLGDIKTLDEVGLCLTSKQLQEPTLNEMTPLEIAVRCKQHASAAWLIDHGVLPDIISLWDLGWKDRVPSLIAEHPELVKRRAGRWTATPLHIAIERNDIDLAKLLLTVPNDLESKDAVFQATPLGWAEHFKRPEFLTLLQSQTLSEEIVDSPYQPRTKC